MDNPPETLSIREAAAILDVSTQRIYQLIEKEKLEQSGPGRLTKASVEKRRALVE